MRKNLHRNVRAALVVALASLIAVSVDGQASRSKKKKTTSSQSRSRSRKKTTRRAVRPAPPAAPAVKYTAPRGVDVLQTDLNSMATRIRSGQFGIMVLSLTRGDTLYKYNEGTPLMPASTMKMLTTALALDRLGPKYRFSTDVLYDGSLSNGTINGNLYLRGDGDPSLSPRYFRGPPDEPLKLLADQLKSKGITHVTGDVVGDASAFDNQLIPEGWLSRYLQSGYAARVSALSINENLVWVTVAPGTGARLEPSSSAVPITNNVKTVPGNGARLSVRRFRDGSVIVGGTIGSRSIPRRYVYVIEDPALYTTGALRANLDLAGIKVDGGLKLGETPSSAVKVASIESPTLDRLISAMNRESINHFAELLLRSAVRGPDKKVQGTIPHARDALHDFFQKEVKVDASTLQVYDGSGLSTLDRITPRTMAQMLSYAHRAEWGPWFHASLPVAGESELLRRRMRGSPAQGNLHAKTGTTNDVIGLGGYVTAANGEVIAFSFLYNGADRWTAKSMIDVMGETLANFAR